MKNLFLFLLSLVVCNAAFAERRWRSEEFCLVDLGPVSCSRITFDTNGNYYIATANYEYYSAMLQRFPYDATRHFNVYFEPAERYLSLKAQYNLQTSYVSSQDLFNDFMNMPDEQWGALRDTLYCGIGVASCGLSAGGSVIAIPLVLLTCGAATIACIDAARSMNKWLIIKRQAELNIGVDAEKIRLENIRLIQEDRIKACELNYNPDGSVTIIDFTAPSRPLPTGIVTSGTVIDGKTVPARLRSD